MVNASIQFIPLDAGKPTYYWVDKAIEIIRNEGLTMEVGPFGTAVEGTREQIEMLVSHLNEQMEAAGCPEWLLQTQWHIRAGGEVTIAEKTRKYR
jgi:uncharacterized protein YqgV (UPF0045/DUF77 family)